MNKTPPIGKVAHECISGSRTYMRDWTHAVCATTQRAKRTKPFRKRTDCPRQSLGKRLGTVDRVAGYVTSACVKCAGRLGRTAMSHDKN